MRNLTFPSLIDYAERIGADFINISPGYGQRFLGVPNYEKLQAIELLSNYTRVIYLDADILISRECPNLLDRVPKECIGAFLASRFSDLHNPTNLEISKALGEIEWRREARNNSILESFNSGVLVLSRNHLPSLEKALPAAEQWCRHKSDRQDLLMLKDQPVLNYIVQREKIPIHDITYRFNHTNARGPSPDRFSSHIIHYAGTSHRQETRLIRTSKLTKMSLDAKVLSLGWLHRKAKRWPNLVQMIDAVL